MPNAVGIAADEHAQGRNAAKHPLQVVIAKDNVARPALAVCDQQLQQPRAMRAHGGTQPAWRADGE
jgi:hypothetical protein